MDSLISNSSGIYKIINILNNDFYIGSAKSFKKRTFKHLWELNNNTHANKHLQRAFNKYGEESFKFEILEECTIDDRLNREQHYIDTLKPIYNISKFATGGNGGILSEIGRLSISNGRINFWNNLSEEDKEYKKNHLSQIRLGKKASDETKLKMSIGIKNAKGWVSDKRIEAVIKSNKEKYSIPVQKFTLDNVLLDEYPSIDAAIHSCGLKYSRILKDCLRNKRYEAYGFIWKIKNN